MAKFKVGDKVRVIDDPNGKRVWLNHLVGNISDVKQIFKCANDGKGCYDIGEDYIIPEEQLELYTTKFKVGDRVRVHYIPPRAITEKRPLSGNEYVISHVRNNVSIYDPYIYRLEGTSYNWCDEELELVKGNTMNTMLKKDLQEFDIVKIRSGEVLMVLRNDRSKDGLAIFSKTSFGCKAYMHNYNDDLTHNGSYESYDIMAVKKFDGEYIYSLMETFFDEYKKNKKYNDPNFKWDWERKEVEEMTLAEVCKALGKEIKIVKE